MPSVMARHPRAAACLALSVGFASWPQPASAWFDAGHMLVAEIARLELPEEDVATLNGVLAMWVNDFPGSGEMTAAAVWPDHIKCKSASSPACRGLLPVSMNQFDSWHFSDIPYNPEKQDLHVNSEGNPSSVWFLSEAMDTFNTSQSNFAYNMMLRFFIHIVGDIHQPLHSASGFFFHDDKFGNLPKGDLGGNLDVLDGPFANLHQLWDAAGGLYMDSWPLTGMQQEQLVENASDLRAASPRSSFEGKLEPPKEGWKDYFSHWASEGHALGESEAYGHGLAPLKNRRPSEAYIQNAQNVSKRQIALGGYRLADMLKVIIPEMRANLHLARPPTWQTEALHYLASIGSLLVGFGATAGLVACLRRRALMQERQRNKLLTADFGAA